MVRAAGAVVAVFLAYCTAMQVNDPDAALWIGLYGVGLALAGAVAVGRAHPVVLLTYAGVSAAGAGFCLRAGLPPSWLDDEVGREAMGLLLQAVLLAALAAGVQRGGRGTTRS